VLLSARLAEAAVTIEPSVASSVPGGIVQFQANGGAGGYQWSVAVNRSGGYVEPNGTYHAGMTPLVEDQVRVTDSHGETATASVAVTFWESLVVRQPTGTTPPRSSKQISVSGGLRPYGFSFVSNASGGIVSSSGVYTAGRRGKVIDVVRVNDAVGQVVNAVFSVGAGLTITPSSAKIAPRDKVDFDASGGDGFPPVWSISQNKSGGSIDKVTGLYEAGPNTHAADIVRAQDSLGNIAEASVSIGGGVAIIPASGTTWPRGTLAFTAAGGTNVFTWSLSSSPSGGTIDPLTGAYTAGSIGSVIDEVYVLDDAGNPAVAVVDVGPAIALTASTTSVAPSGTSYLSVSGGSGTYVSLAFETNESGGTVNQDFVYTAGSKEGNDTVIVTDSVGSSARVTIAVKAVDNPARSQPPGTSDPSANPRDGKLSGGGGCRAVVCGDGAARDAPVALVAVAAILGLRRRHRAAPRVGR
jgi:hypothetical protein